LYVFGRFEVTEGWLILVKFRAPLTGWMGTTRAQLGRRRKTIQFDLNIVFEGSEQKPGEATVH